MGEDIEVVQLRKQLFPLNVFVQSPAGASAAGGWEGKTVIVTVHDLASNHTSMIAFVDHPSMADVKQRVVFLHVCLPGQEDNAPDFTDPFPTMDQLADGIVHVLDVFNVKSCICLGQGAGADILLRFAKGWPGKVLGMVLVHAESTAIGFVDSFKDHLKDLFLDADEMTDTAWDYIIAHKFGKCDRLTKQFWIEGVKGQLNQRNLSKFVWSYKHRPDFEPLFFVLPMMEPKILLITGQFSPHNENVFHLQKKMSEDELKSIMLVVDNAVDVFADMPEEIARALILHCQACGELLDVKAPRLEE